MEFLWAPWRMEYILRVDKQEGCIFCIKPRENDDRGNLILYRGRTCFVILNRYPYNNAHLMIVPYRHTADLSDLSDEERAELMDLLSKSISVLKEKVSPHGFNIGMNLGRIAGAGVHDHLHFHVVPRWEGDTNFMPVVGHTKVMSEALEETWEKLRGGFEKLTSSSPISRPSPSK